MLTETVLKGRNCETSKNALPFYCNLKLHCVWYWQLVFEMATAVQILNIGESCFSHAPFPRLEAHTGCQIEETQQEWA